MLTRCDKEKLKMLQHGNNEDASDQSESDGPLGSDDGPSELKGHKVGE